MENALLAVCVIGFTEKEDFKLVIRTCCCLNGRSTFLLQFPQDALPSPWPLFVGIFHTLNFQD